MAKDYQYLKEKIIRMQQRLDESEDERARLENHLEVVKTENVKFVSDIKIMKNEHSEIMHTMSNIEKKIDQLERENWYFKSIIERNERRESIQSTFEKPVMLTEDQENTSDFQNRVFIGDTYPKTQSNAESRCTPFKIKSGMVNCMSSDRINQSNVSSIKDTYYIDKKPSRRRFLIPKPDSRMTAEFNE
jgi:hypothetical protein